MDHTIVIRRLMIDLKQDFARHWLGGDAFRTQFFNALSMSFPVGEQFFIDSVKKVVPRMPVAEQQRLAGDIRAFIGQEATHRHLHGQFNAQLEKLGLVNRWQHWANWRIERGKNFHPLNHLAVTAAYEHLTATLADLTLRHADILDGAQAPLGLLWSWHAVEETEHKSVALQVYRSAGGSERHRILWFVYSLILFSIECTLQTFLNLKRDGTLGTFRGTVRAFASGISFMLGRRGMLWRCTLPFLAYLSPSFDPDRHDNRDLAQHWLQQNTEVWRAADAGLG